MTAPISSLFSSGGPQLERASNIVKEAAKKKMELERNDDGNVPSNGVTDNNSSSKGIETLQETPFGRRASLMLPKIENEVLIGAKRGLNRWFLRLRSGGDGAKAGRAVLRRCAHSMAAGPGNLGLGGHMPPVRTNIFLRLFLFCTCVDSMIPLTAFKPVCLRIIFSSYVPCRHIYGELRSATI